MSTIRLLIACIAVLLSLSVTAHAQVVVTGPVTTSHAAVWDQENISSAAAAAALTPMFRIDGAGPFSPTGVTCIAFVPATPNKWTCRVNLNAQMVSLLNLTGSHSMVLRMLDPTTKLEGTDSVPFVLTSPPAAPTGLRVIP